MSGKLMRAAAALAVGLAGAVVALELALRAFPGLMPQQALLRMHWRELLEGNETRSVADPELGFVFRPGQPGEYALKDLAFTYSIDQRGFRNPSPWPESAEIVVLGDSLAFGFGVEDGETWSRLLDAGLERAEVVNLALPGYCPEQYARTWARLRAELAPELVLVGVFPTNDVRDQQKFGQWLQAGAPGNYDAWRFGGGGGGGLLGRSYLAVFARAALENRARHFEDRRLELDEGPLNLTPGIVAGSSRAAERGNPSFDAAAGSLERLLASASGSGARVLFVLFPCKEEVYLPLLELPTPEPVKPFVELFRERGWDYLDLTPVFRERAAEGERLYFEIDGHPDRRGNQVTAEAVRAWILENTELR